MLAELFFALFLAVQLFYELMSEASNYFYMICFSLPANALAVLLGIVFRYLQVFNKKLDGVFCDPRLMFLHFLAFLLATLFSDITLVLGIILASIDPKDFPERHKER